MKQGLASSCSWLRLPRGKPVPVMPTVVLALVSFLGGAAWGADAPASLAPGVEHRFEGGWSAVGTRQELAVGPDRKAVIVYLSGSLVLQTAQGISRGFLVEAIGFDNGRDISTVECVWTDDRGDRVYSELKGESIKAGKHFLGTITGGSGRYAGATGSYELDWQYAMLAEDGTFHGRAVNFKGVIRGPAPTASPTTPASPAPKAQEAP